MAAMGANEVLAAVPGVTPPPSIYALSNLTSVEVGVGAGIGEGREVPVTLTFISTPLASSIVAILALVPTKTEVKEILVGPEACYKVATREGVATMIPLVGPEAWFSPSSSS